MQGEQVLMKFVTKSLAVFFMLLPAPLALAEELADPFAGAVSQIAEEVMKKNNIPGLAVELYVNGKPHEYYFGYANQQKKTPVTKDTVFELGSLSKLMTTLIMTQEVDFAFMGFNDSIRKYVKELPPSFDKVTLRQLATHTAGLPFNVPKTITTPADLSNYLTANWKPEDDPDEVWQYSNLGISLLGMAVQNLTTVSYEKLYRSHITYPLGMHPISFNVPERFQPFYAQGYAANGEAVAPEPLNPLTPATGDLKASASDMQHFLSAAIDLPSTPERILYPMMMMQVAYVKLPSRSQGLVWEIHPLSSGTRWLLNDVPNGTELAPKMVEEVVERPTFNPNALIDKTGMTSGFKSYIAVIPAKKSGIVLLANKRMDNRDLVKAGRKILFEVNRL